ncbi:MAG TPA: 23S rRNA (pseudouridine(1915)-N(3))-methyltransferase RlmH [Pyrinomonadaceae bacterium]|nr:23S rRNA (pseudouridine(1915)-N(3))-methyltransferase RlmH [Pyrinomonadaceae bacterium]
MILLILLLMRIRVVWLGKTRDAHLRALVDDYLKRLRHFVHCEITEIRESVDARTKAGIDKDSKRISDALNSGALTILLDAEGTEFTSRGLARQVQKWENSGTKEVEFIIGGPQGVSKEVLDRVHKRWSLSRLTLTHEMTRVLLLEQLYRAYTIIHGLPYHK